MERALSQWGMMVDPEGSEAQKRNRGKPRFATFAETIEAELSELREWGITAECTNEDFERWRSIARLTVPMEPH